jgi:4,5-DOPA dioxygenase extradiol
MERKDFLKMMAMLPLTASAMKLNELSQITDGFAATEKLPVLFIGHGNPMNALYDNAFTKSLSALGEGIRKQQVPNAILVVSAHWLTRGSYVNISKKPETIHDFGGFPQELFNMQYSALGSPTYAHQVTQLAPNVKETNDWGLDHGTWTVLAHMYPNADIPVFQLSIDYAQPMQYHVDLSKKLQSLREKGVLVIGSGNIVHNLQMSVRSFQMNDEKFKYDWAVEFDEWTKDKLNKHDFQSLVDYEKMGKAAKLSVPTIDHYVPLLYTIGMAGKNENLTYTYEEVSFGGMSMRCVKIG